MLFLDATVLVGAADRKDAFHADGRSVVEAIVRGAIGPAYVSAFVVGEMTHILGHRKNAGPGVATRFAEHLLDSRLVTVVPADEQACRDTLQAYRQFGPKLNVFDASTLAMMARTGCRVLYSHDRGFDRVPGIERRERVD